MTKDADPPISVERLADAGLIRLTRPDTKNPLSIETLDALELALAELESEKVKRIVITGSGDTFASGANLREVAELDPVSAAEFGERGQRLMLAVYRSRVPVCAAIDGYCFGGALDLATACRWRIASSRSVFCHPGPRLGIITGWGGTQLLPRLIGGKPALDMLLTARVVKSDEAFEMGLVDAISENPVTSAIEWQRE